MQLHRLIHWHHLIASVTEVVTLRGSWLFLFVVEFSIKVQVDHVLSIALLAHESIHVLLGEILLVGDVRRQHAMSASTHIRGIIVELDLMLTLSTLW